jgi:hypothetical protein
MEGVLKNGTPVEVGILFETPSFFPLFFHMVPGGHHGKREENLTMVLNSLQPLAIGFTSPCTLLPCTQAPILLNALQLHPAFH